MISISAYIALAFWSRNVFLEPSLVVGHFSMPYEHGPNLKCHVYRPLTNASLKIIRYSKFEIALSLRPSSKVFELCDVGDHL